MWKILASIFMLAWSIGASAAQNALDPGALAQPGYVLLLRHAIAPGVGDPAAMRIGDCATQRNLDATGRAQATAIGAALRAAGIGAGADPVRVYSSQWCRTLETARLLGFGAPVELPAALNSFFEDRGQGPPATAALRAWLATQPRGGALQVLVTHQVNITALTGIVPASGEGVALRLLPDGDFAIAGRLRAPG
jgi:phosphohistidine phosphatase SixA